MKVWEDCGLGYESKVNDLYHGRITDDEFEEWYNYHCEMCPFMGEICYYGEELPNGEIYNADYIEQHTHKENQETSRKLHEQCIEDSIDLTEWSDW